MSSACGEPPDSGENASPKALPVHTRSSISAAGSASAARRRRGRVRRGAAKGSGIVFTARRATSLAPSASTTGEHGLPALEEGRDALGEVAGGGHLLLDGGLELELLAHARVDPVVELALDPGVRARRAAREPLEQRVGLGLERVVGRDAVDQPPL